MFGSSSVRRLGAACLTAIVLVAGATVASAAATQLSLGRLGIGGTGCPAGTASASVSPDGSRVMVRFRQFQVAAGGARSFDRKACNLAIPISVPAGMSVALVEVNYAGSTRLPSGASATIAVETFFAGGRGPAVERSIAGPKSGRFSFSTNARGTIWSACGASTNLRVSTSLRVRTSGAAASASIRAQDVDAALVYRLKYRRC